jgi:hypothetical protein
MEFTKDEIAAWLKSHNRSREWLAEATGKSLGTIHNWFSNRSIPDDARATIALLMERDLQERESALNAPVDDTGLITFSTSEFERIERARAAVGSPTRPQFYREAIIQYVEDVEAGEAVALAAEGMERAGDGAALERRPVVYPTGKGKKG